MLIETNSLETMDLLDIECIKWLFIVMNYLPGRCTPICCGEFWHDPWTLHKMNSVV